MRRARVGRRAGAARPVRERRRARSRRRPSRPTAAYARGVWRLGIAWSIRWPEAAGRARPTRRARRRSPRSPPRSGRPTARRAAPRAARSGGTSASGSRRACVISLPSSGSIARRPSNVVTTTGKKQISAMITSLGSDPEADPVDEQRREDHQRHGLRADHQRVQRAAQQVRRCGSPRPGRARRRAPAAIPRPTSSAVTRRLSSSSPRSSHSAVATCDGEASTRSSTPPVST